ncbi:nuclear transport factor 2 family protein [Litoribrevibacter euphylliae]|uniref:Nuclear transport factor 2 family protein n=1 Tax=Litoribrevibacter euphylliae TaxID=1834034 RepID=A0ABV7HAQ9_9GAMM
MMEQEKLSPNVQRAIEYFEKIDAGDESYLALFSEDVRFFFPKFGTHQGKQSLIRFGERIGSSLSQIQHDIANFNFIEAGNMLVVEGQESGVMADGTVWPDGKVSQGRFCSVFEFSGGLINRMFIYVDPDFPSTDSARISVLSEN